ncbi:MAG: tetratricopeptide repeat protein, partial [Armatimonadaceae bacterium]
MQRRPLLATLSALGVGGIVLGIWLIVDRFDPVSASLPELRARVRAVPDDPYAQRWLGRRLVELGDTVGGFEALAIASDLRPDNPQIRADTVTAAYRAHGLPAADAVAADFLGNHPGERFVTAARALAYATEGLGGELDVRRVQCLATALRLDPSRTDAARRLAEVLDESGFHRAARRILESAVKHDPRDVAAWHHLGRLRSTDDVPGAVEALRRAAELAPKEPTLRLDLASVLLTANRLSDADREYEQALQVGPEDTLVLTEVGKRWISQPGKLAAGEKLLGQLEWAKPPVPEALAALGGIRLRQGRLEEADRLLTRALSGKLDSPAEAMYALSRCAAR